MIATLSIINALVLFYVVLVICGQSRKIKSLKGRILQREIWGSQTDIRIGDIECNKLIERANEVLKDEKL